MLTLALLALQIVPTTNYASIHSLSRCNSKKGIHPAYSELTPLLLTLELALESIHSVITAALRSLCVGLDLGHLPATRKPGVEFPDVYDHTGSKEHPIMTLQPQDLTNLS